MVGVVEVVGSGGGGVRGSRRSGRGKERYAGGRVETGEGRGESGAERTEGLSTKRTNAFRVICR